MVQRALSVKDCDYRDFFAKLLQHPRLIEISRNSVELVDFQHNEVWLSLYKAICELDAIKVPCSFVNVNKRLLESVSRDKYDIILDVIRNSIAVDGRVNSYDLELIVFKKLCNRIVAYNVVEELDNAIIDVENPDHNKDMSVERKLTIFDNVVARVASRVSKVKDEISARELDQLVKTVDDYEAYLETYSQEVISAVCPFGIPELDKRLSGGLKPRNLHIIAALTGGGKSWFGTHVAKQCIANRVGCLYFALEMTSDETRTRIAQCCTYATEPGSKYSDMSIISSEKFLMFKELVQDSAKHGAYLDIISHPASTASVRVLEDGIIDFMTRYGSYPTVVIVDGIPNIRNEYKSESYLLGEKAIVQGLDRLAKTYNVAILATHQLNKEAYGDNGAHGGTLSGSHDISRAAAVIITIEEHSVGKFHRLHKIKFIKVRHGETVKGVVVFVTNKDLGQLYEFGTDIYIEDKKKLLPPKKQTSNGTRKPRSEF